MNEFDKLIRQELSHTDRSVQLDPGQIAQQIIQQKRDYDRKSRIQKIVFTGVAGVLVLATVVAAQINGNHVKPSGELTQAEDSPAKQDQTLESDGLAEINSWTDSSAAKNVNEMLADTRAQQDKIALLQLKLNQKRKQQVNRLRLDKLELISQEFSNFDLNYNFMQ